MLRKMQAVYWFFRILAALIMVVILLFFGLGFLKTVLPAASNKPPMIVTAPFAIQTSSRFYYARTYMVNGSVTTIRDYWVYDGAHYTFVKGDLPLPYDTYGAIVIINRNQ